MSFDTNHQISQLLIKTRREIGSQSGFNGSNFMAHISIGSLKPGADRQKALAKLNQLLANLKSDPTPFVIYDIEFDRVKNGQNQVVVQANLPRKDVGIRGIESNGTHHAIKLNSAQQAAKLSNRLLKHYKIGGAHNPSVPKQVTTCAGSPALLLTHEEFARVQGHFANMPLSS